MSGTIPLAPPGTGMISSASPFVAPDLTPAPLSFRFLFELWKDCGDYARRLAALEAKMGVTDGSNASAGQVGEYLTANGSNAGLVSLAQTDIATLTLTAGDWDVTGSALIQPAGANVLAVDMWLNTVANTLAGPMNAGIQAYTPGPVGVLAAVTQVVGPARYSVAAPATLAVHLGCRANFPSGTVSATAFMRARRVR